MAVELPNGFTLAGSETRAGELAMSIYPASRIAYINRRLLQSIGNPDHIELAYSEDGRRVVIRRAVDASRYPRKLHKHGTGASLYVPVEMVQAIAGSRRSVKSVRVTFAPSDGDIALGNVQESE